MATMKYVCDLRYDPNDESITMAAIQAVFPTLSIQAVEFNSADPLITPGRVRCTIQDVDMALHGEIMQVPGVELFSGDIA